MFKTGDDSIMKFIIYFLIFFYSFGVHAESENSNDVKIYYELVPVDEITLHLNNKERIDLLENRLSEVRRDQLNYKIENGLLKETYKINYERINIFITIILGIIAILGFLGIRDIGIIKKEYEAELINIKGLKNQFELKNIEIDNSKKRIDDDLKNIIKENQEQNEKIKFIELKEKAATLFKDRQLSLALEFVNAALEIDQNNAMCLNIKGSILSQLNQLPEALTTFAQSMQQNPEDTGSKFNYAECLFLSGKIDEGNKLVEQNKQMFTEKHNGELLEYFKMLEHYYKSDIQQLKKLAKSYVTYYNKNKKVKKLGSWILKDAQIFTYHLDDSDLKAVIQNLIWYWNEQITGKTLLTRLKIPLPSKPKEE
jgi:hypothetical protein